MAVAEIDLNRGQIKEIVGEDLRKIRVFETLIASAIVQDDVDSGLRITRWGNGRMEVYPDDPSAASSGTVTFPIPFINAKINIAHAMFRAAGAADSNFTVTALSATGFSWVATTSAKHLWRAVGSWK